MLPKRAEWCAENFRNVTIFDNTAARKELGYRYTIRWEEHASSLVQEIRPYDQ